MKKRHCWPEGHWNWPVQLVHKHGLRCGEMIWVGGQVDMTPDGQVLNHGDLALQTRRVMGHVARVLEDLDCDLEDLVTLLAFYVDDGSVDRAAFLKTVGACLVPGSRVTVTAVPVPWLAYRGLAVEIEGYAMRRKDGARMPRRHAPPYLGSPLPPPFVQGICVGRMIFLSAQLPISVTGSVFFPGDVLAQTRLVMAQASRILGHFGAGLADVVKINRWYAGGAGIADFLSQPSVADSHTRGDQRRPYGIVGESITYERVSSSFAGQQIHSVIMNMPPGYRSERIRHEGEEFEFVLSGSVTSEIEGQTLVLEAGDSVHYRSNRPHCLWNHSCEPARVLWVGTLDLFEEGGGNAGQGGRHSSRSPAEVEPTTREKTHE